MTLGKTELESRLEHSHAAYLFAVNSLPDKIELRSGDISKSGLKFSHEDQIHSMLIEFGWAFFCRYEACLEKFLKDNGVKLTKKTLLCDWFETNNVEIPENLGIGLKQYRQLRNALHHDDGASLNGEADEEIHFLPEHMQRFYELFVWVGQQVNKVNVRAGDNP